MTQEIERLRLSKPTRLAITSSEPPELDQARLVGMQLQGELREPFAKVAEEPLRIGPMLEPGHKVVRLCRGPDYAEDRYWWPRLTWLPLRSCR